MQDVSHNSTLERRRSKRISESIPLIVRGVDLLGHPFEERTATLALNLQGCRYPSKYHLPRNSWVSIEVAQGGETRSVRARVAWIHRPHSIGELFQVAVELDGASNIWGLELSPAEWTASSAPSASGNGSRVQNEHTAPILAEIPLQGRAIPMNSYAGDALNGREHPPVGGPPNYDAAPEGDSTAWREQLASEMAVAQRQWEELLQSSMDRSLQRLAEELPGRAQEAVRGTEEKMAQQFAQLNHMLAQMSSEAQNALSVVKSSIEQEISKAREAIELARQQLLERVAAEAESRIAPHAARVPELLRELSGREEQMAESLRMHRERLRHASDNTLREMTGHAEAAAAEVRSDFEAARRAALAKWKEELDALTVRAEHAAAESLSRTSGWVQQETRERLQVLSEQTLADARAKFEEETTKAAGLFATHLEGQSIFHLAQVHQQLDGVADDLAGRTRTQLAEAAEAAAASFGQVLHTISGVHTEEFDRTSQSAVDAKRQEVDNYARQMRAAFESESAAAIQTAREQAGSHLQSAVAEASAALASESAAAIDAHRNEYAARAHEWSLALNRVAEEAMVQGAGRIQNAADTAALAAARRLSEHGENVIEALMRSAGQALRDSASKMFEGLAVALREQAVHASSSAAAGNGTANP